MPLYAIHIIQPILYKGLHGMGPCFGDPLQDLYSTLPESSRSALSIAYHACIAPGAYEPPKALNINRHVLTVCGYKANYAEPLYSPALSNKQLPISIAISFSYYCYICACLVVICRLQ